MQAPTPRATLWRRWLLRIALAIAALLLALAGGSTMLEWRPAPRLDTPVHPGGAEKLPAPSSLRVLSWNLGYAGLGRDADFFMDGGRQVRPASAAVVQSNLDGILAQLRGEDLDLLLLQEVDRDATRTYRIDQVAALTAALPEFSWSGALNFKVPWVPVPLRQPMGRVRSGLLTLGRFGFSAAVRHQLPGDYAWPVRVFHLKRCLHELRFAAADGKDWVVLHLHLSAFDKGGQLRRQQMVYTRELMLKRHAEGHHVIVGGDWNQAFPGLNADHFSHRSPTPSWFQRAPEDWLPEGWSWAFDASVPSLRANDRPYTPGDNFVTTVDGFALSPEIEVEELRCVDLGFEHSDHQPVSATLRLRGAGSN